MWLWVVVVVVVVGIVWCGEESRQDQCQDFVNGEGKRVSENDIGFQAAIIDA